MRPGNTYVVEDDEGLSPATAGVANGVIQPVTSQGGDQLLGEEEEEREGNKGEEEVVNQEDGLKLEGLTGAHELPAAEDDGVVDDDEGRGRLEGRHGRLKGHKLELVGRVANNGRPDLVEQGPEVDAKGPVEGRPREVGEESVHDGPKRDAVRVS